VMRSILQWLAAAALPLLYSSNKMHVFTFFIVLIISESSTLQTTALVVECQFHAS